MVPGDLRVSMEGSMEGSTLPEDATASSHYLLSMPARALLTGSPRVLKAGILTGAAPAGGSDPMRAC